ncbi:5-methylcytosine restriction system specificity protein McrC [Riemerella anatipestifer]|uniref:5-methylcytosine restriction system specificity protein McrC n=1 Tax=Riemerella anatipestifer TaxID=34085 RepID=UPI0009A1C200|nr:hypothetical protein [Riemerella anatipestifer]MBO4232914.1 hypothetical protein [Riemerella anatipestifer]MCO4303789.1 McrC family protein [Riemerella anatipestifer]MCO7351917.1 McrC family protein [Riemerella anatipestifer]MCQ4039162.1 McrC family protein [Riemerella anatipestifer]MCT6760757.1 McrC family protein [Riemerella anatipestifer]
MLKLTEHHHYKESFTKQELLERITLSGDLSIPQAIYFKRNNALCFRVDWNSEKYFLETSYYIGLCKIKEWGKTLLISPKVNNEEQKLDVLGMLMEALTEPENFNHLEGLTEIYFEEKWIEIETDTLVPLTLFLVIQFLMTTKQIVRMGLKKSYYNQKESLRNRIKGKILVSEQVKRNALKQRFTYTVCSYQEFGINTEGNQFIKYVLKFVKSYISNYQNDKLKDKLKNILNYNLAVFNTVEDKTFSEFKKREDNVFYKIYNTVYSLGNQILKLTHHSYENTSHKKCKYPPHWIDMSKLFELYVFKKLREQFPERGEVIYHYKANYQELDFLINSNGLKAVVDAKYKPRYNNSNPSKEDIRQLSGYARLEKIYRELNVEDNKIIPAYIIYPNTPPYHIAADNLEEVSIVEKKDKIISIGSKETKKINAYKDMYLIEIDLPYI